MTTYSGDTYTVINIDIFLERYINIRASRIKVRAIWYASV